MTSSRSVMTEKRTHVRYWILALLFVITAINYGDRATLSITAPAMSADFGFSPVQVGYLFSAFGWAYVMAQVPGGMLLDKFGTRRVYAASIGLWSLFTLLQSVLGVVSLFGSTLVALFMLRFAVGLAEAPAFPGNAKTTANWFPAAERGRAAAIFNSAQYFAPVVFTPLMAWLTHAYSWHFVYIVMGVLGLIMMVVWLIFARSPEETRAVNAAELAHIRRDDEAGAATSMGEPRRGPFYYIGRLLTSRMFLGIYVAQFCINALTYFFLTWFPVYLVEQRGMTILHAGVVASLPAICGFAGGVLGGFFSDYLMRFGLSLTAARKIPIILGMLLSTTMVACNYVDTNALVIAIMALSFFGKGLGALGWAVISDTAPREAVGVSGGLFNTFGNAAGIVTPIVIGYIVATTGSYNAALVFVACNALAAILLYLFVVGKIERKQI